MDLASCWFLAPSISKLKNDYFFKALHPFCDFVITLDFYALGRWRSMRAVSRFRLVDIIA